MSCANSQNEYTGDGSETGYLFTFEYEQQAEVQVEVLNTTTGEYEVKQQDDATYGWAFNGLAAITFTTAPADGVQFKIARNTIINPLQATFYPGSSIRAQDLNNNFEQLQRAIEDSNCDRETLKEYVDENYWDKLGDTLEAGDTWVADDEHIATAARGDERWLKKAGDGSDITTEADQIAGNVPDDDVHVFSNAASIERHDNIVSDTNPGNQSQDGKIWIESVNERIQYWNADLGAWVDTSQTGPIGPTGPQGPSGTITVGGTTTSAAGGDAEVTNSGTNTNAIFDFVIPRGEVGPVGPEGPQGPAGAGVSFQGNVDATLAGSAPANPNVGDLWVNSGNGNLDASWGIGTIPILQGWTLAWAANGIWNVQEPALAADLWEQNADGQIQPVQNRQVFLENQQNFGGTPVNPALSVSGTNGAVDTGFNVPAAGSIGVTTGGTANSVFDADGLQVGPAIQLQGANERIVVGNTTLGGNLINNVGNLNVGVNGDVVISATQTDVIIPTDEFSVEGEAAPGNAVNIVTGNVYRVDAATLAGNEAWWIAAGMTTPVVGGYFTAAADAAVPGGNTLTQVLDPANLVVSGNGVVGGSLTVNNITFPDGSVLETGGASVVISDNPPADPGEGDLWWNSIEGELFIWYNDGTSEQWVQANGGSSINLDEVIDVEEGSATPSLEITNTGLIQLPVSVTGDAIFTNTNRIAAVNGNSVDVNGQTDVRLRVGSTERLRLNTDGALSLSGQFGNAGQVLTSQGGGAAPQWATPDAGGGSGSNFTVINSITPGPVILVGIPTTANIITYTFRGLDLDSSNVGLEMRFGNSVGTLDTSNSYVWAGRRLGGSELSDRGSPHNSIILVSSGHAVGSDSGYFGVVTISRSFTGGSHDGYVCSWTISAERNSATQIVGNGYYNAAFDAESIGIFPQNGNIKPGAHFGVSWS